MDCAWPFLFVLFLSQHALTLRRVQCTTADNYLVAHYDLKPADVRAYGVSGNNLTIYEPFAHLTLGEFLVSGIWPLSCVAYRTAELLASFIIMRHIQQYNL